MKVDGGCHCGNIRYEAEVDPAKVVICHCTDCQTLSGSAFRTVVPTNEGTFRLLPARLRSTSRRERAETDASKRSAPIAARRSILLRWEWVLRLLVCVSARFVSGTN